MSDELSLRMDLLDRQIVDADELPFGRVDDAVIDVPGDEVPRVTGLLTGAQALGERLGSGFGRAIARGAARLRRDPSSGPGHIGVGLIDTIDQQVRLRAPLHELEHVAGLEHWLAQNFIGRIPGAGDARE